MNKEEVIKELMSDSRKVVFGDDENVYLSRKRTIELISKIDEPKEVRLPQGVASWLKYCLLTNVTIRDALCFDEICAYNWAEQYYRDEVIDWLKSSSNQNKFVRAWLDGLGRYEVELLYTVDLPVIINGDVDE